MAVRLQQPLTSAEWQWARQLIEEYAAALKVDLCFQNFSDELAHLATEYAPPTGAFLLANDGDTNLGCVGVRRFAGGTGEIKRLFVSPAARGRGIGRLLAESIINAARELGYERVLLDTLPSMTEARKLYASLGFTPIEAYRFNPIEGTAFLELRLR